MTINIKSKMNVFVVTIESESEVKLMGMYANEKLAKEAMKSYVDNEATENEKTYKKKVPKKEATKKLMYEFEKEDEKVSVFMLSGEVEGVKQVGKAKAKKDPNEPKRGLSPYMLFANENRDKLKKENPDASFGETGKLLGAAWKALTDKQKEKYNKKAEEDKARYEKEMTAYTEAEQ